MKRKPTKLKRLRVPKGVYVAGRPMGGRFVGPEQLVALASEAERGFDRIQRLVGRQERAATRQRERAERRFEDDPKRFAGARQAAEDEAKFWGAAEDRLDSLSGEPLDDLATEWEIGFDYNSVTGYGHADVSSRDVDVNIRISRTDGRAFSQREATAMLKDFRANLARGRAPSVPTGYQLAMINWRRPRGGTGWSNGDESDLAEFRNPMYMHHDDEGAWELQPVTTRMGSVDQ